MHSPAAATSSLMGARRRRNRHPLGIRGEPRGEPMKQLAPTELDTHGKQIALTELGTRGEQLSGRVTIPTGRVTIPTGKTKPRQTNMLMVGNLVSRIRNFVS